MAMRQTCGNTAAVFAGKSVNQLLSFENNMELKSLRIVNSLPEEFLDQNLSELFLNDNSDTANQ